MLGSEHHLACLVAGGCQVEAHSPMVMVVIATMMTSMMRTAERVRMTSATAFPQTWGPVWVQSADPYLRRREGIAATRARSPQAALAVQERARIRERLAVGCQMSVPVVGGEAEEKALA